MLDKKFGDAPPSCQPHVLIPMEASIVAAAVINGISLVVGDCNGLTLAGVDAVDRPEADASGRMVGSITGSSDCKDIV